jgi:hypothetical protein
MKHDTEMSSGAMIYIPSLIKTSFGIQKLIGRDTQTARRSHKPTFIFHNKEIRLSNETDVLYNLYNL